MQTCSFSIRFVFYVLHLVSLKMSGEEEEGAAFLPKARKTGIWTSVKGSDDVEGPKTEGENVPEPEETKELGFSSTSGLGLLSLAAVLSRTDSSAVSLPLLDPLGCGERWTIMVLTSTSIGSRLLVLLSLVVTLDLEETSV